MANDVITSITVRSKSALTTNFVMATEEIYADSDNTPAADPPQDFSTTGGNADREWMARKFKTPSVSHEWVSTIALTLGVTGSGGNAPAGTLEAYIFTDSSSLPDAQLSGSGASDSVTCTDITTDAAGETVTFRWTRDCPFLSPSTNYWVVIKSTGYTYTNGVTEVRWRTDANGAAGLSECAKYDANAGTPWSTIGADVGADLAVNAALRVSVADKNQVILYADYTPGSSTEARIKVEFSNDDADWVQESIDSISGGVRTTTPLENRVTSATPVRIPIPVGDSLMRISVKAVTSATNAELGIVANSSYV